MGLEVDKNRAFLSIHLKLALRLPEPILHPRNLCKKMMQLPVVVTLPSLMVFVFKKIHSPAVLHCSSYKMITNVMPAELLHNSCFYFEKATDQT